MTRFARAKGSKASNERIPEEATSWREMKQQLVEKNKQIEEGKKKQEADQQRTKNYEAFLRNVEEEQSKDSKWAEFPTANTAKKNKVNGIEKKVKNKTAPKMKLLENGGDTHNETKTEVVKTIKTVINGNKLKVKKKQTTKLSTGPENVEQNNNQEKAKISNKGNKKSIQVVEQKTQEVTDNLNSNQTSTKVKTITNGNKLKKKKKIASKVNTRLENVEQKPENTAENSNSNESVVNKAKTGNNKRNSEFKANTANKISKTKGVKRKPDPQNPETPPSKKIKKPEELTEDDVKKIERKKQKKQRQLEKRKQLKQPTEKNDGKIHQRRKKTVEKMFINGKEVDVAYMDGFPIKKEDCDRIIQLRKQMISKGLPRSEIKIALKLERRKAEKAFAREKKKVCFNCRKSGHNLSECPELGKEQLAESAGTGICFKCGSTEHTHFECKVVRGQEFKFAQCFICHEQGHIARQCPDNARGLYPKGGACRVCGDVTHLKKDCPKFQAQQQQLEQSLHIETMAEGENPDSLGDSGHSIKSTQGKRPNKIVKF